MTMAPFEASQEELQDIFSKNSPTSETTRKETIKKYAFSELSMGMSRDFEVAIANGATYVRIGTSFFK